MVAVAADEGEMPLEFRCGRGDGLDEVARVVLRDQMTYDLPTDIDGHKVFSLKRKDGDRKLDFIPQDQLDESVPDPSVSSGRPIVYTLWYTYVRLWPIPDSAITMYLRYVKKITEVADDTTTLTEIPDRWENVVLDGVKVRAFSFDRRPNEAAIAKADYDVGIERMQNDNEMIIDYKAVVGEHTRGLRSYAYERPITE